ncbi:peptidoglycan synthetase [Pedobacter yulinensis]|uniref:Peptidoglycan synthetase n=1 Tax=Pedobacter yulinensis TaxID=2126353 RepID=A0A2T3HI69_9SPHI|nr:Mur ligase family protein [Pedobacter yulinensis]PST82132.1 peptidoglycan synthetase [Pedobacter yulinensis]
MRIHLIAIGGSAMHNLAMALKQKGYEVSGSDDVIYDPARSRLEKYGILPAETGWDENRITPELDAVILGMHAREDNPELRRAQELGIRIFSYPEYIYEQSKEKLRVVIGGSHGKTTITSMILHVLKASGREFDYLVGAQLEGFETMVSLSNAPVIIIEGDEYLASAIDRRPKFHLYHANLAVISGIAWDHINVFPTVEIYREQFERFIETITPGGTLIYSEDDAELEKLVNANQSHIEKIPYGVPGHSVEAGRTYLRPGNIPLQVFGIHNLLNLSAAKAVCLKLGIGADDFDRAISSFRGAAKRLELLASSEHMNVYKDFAHSPSKLKATIAAVKSQFPERKLVACVELHTFSSLDKRFLGEYAGSMDLADEAIVFIDEKTFVQKRLQPFHYKEVQISFNNLNLHFYKDVETLEKHLRGLAYGSANLLLMSSGNFAGMDLVRLANELIKD